MQTIKLLLYFKIENWFLKWWEFILEKTNSYTAGLKHS